MLTTFARPNLLLLAGSRDFSRLSPTPSCIPVVFEVATLLSELAKHSLLAIL
ncbi:MAG: hypothetical protein QS721_06690 [Candidatus Endonucleobacter sp. (ex Gigantidas childressi)]|nr:hypothetical protein [Candidatus Endonucleobacter sp. (ex Gigantidas childressi)]